MHDVCLVSDPSDSHYLGTRGGKENTTTCSSHAHNETPTTPDQGMGVLHCCIQIALLFVMFMPRLIYTLAPTSFESQGIG